MATLIEPINDTDHRLGSLNAPIQLVEYGDYQCQTCRLTNPILKQFEKEFGEKLVIVFRHFPYKHLHPLAFLGAQAAEAAAKQNHFWEMHNFLFENQLKLTSEFISDAWKPLSLDSEQFRSDLKSPEVIKVIEHDFQLGARSGVNGTPTFFINTVRYDGDLSFSAFQAALTKQLTHPL